MKRPIRQVAAIALLLVAAQATLAGGFVNQSKLAQWCLSDHPEESSACMGYTAGAYDRLWATGMFYDGTVACPPKSLTPQRLTEAVVAFLQNGQMTSEVIAIVAVLGTLQEKWPCGFGFNTGSMAKNDVFRARCTSSDYGDIAWCTGFVAGTSDAAVALYETGNTAAESFALRVRSLTWGDVLEAVKQYIAENPERNEAHDIPYFIIEDAVDE